jgi:hypothetical protein
MDRFLEPPVEIRPGMAAEIFERKLNQHFTERAALLKLKRQMQSRLGELELGRWKERIEMAIADGQAPDILHGARELILDTQAEVDPARVMDTATNLLNQLSAAQEKRRLQFEAKAAVLNQRADGVAVRQQGTAPSTIIPQVRSPQPDRQAAHPTPPLKVPRTASPVTATPETQDHTSAPDNLLVRLWDTAGGWLLFFLVAGIALTTLVATVNREKWELTIYCDYTDVAMILCAPIVGFIVYGFLGSLSLPSWLATSAGLGMFGFIEWRVLQQPPHANEDGRSAVLAFVAKHGVILTWLFAVSIYLSMGTQRAKGESEKEYQIRRDRELWRDFIIMLLVTTATALLIRRLTRSRDFSNVWSYLQGKPIRIRETGSQQTCGETWSEHAETYCDDDQEEAGEPFKESDDSFDSGGESEAEETPCPWEILGVTPGASEDQIRAAYRARMQEYHPDRVAHLGPDLRKLAEEKTKSINEAYSTLIGKRGRRSARHAG